MKGVPLSHAASTISSLDREPVSHHILEHITVLQDSLEPFAVARAVQTDVAPLERVLDVCKLPLELRPALACRRSVAIELVTPFDVQKQQINAQAVTS